MNNQQLMNVVDTEKTLKKLMLILNQDYIEIPKSNNEIKVFKFKGNQALVVFIKQLGQWRALILDGFEEEGFFVNTEICYEYDAVIYSNNEKERLISVLNGETLAEACKIIYDYKTKEFKLTNKYKYADLLQAVEEKEKTSLKEPDEPDLTLAKKLISYNFLTLKEIVKDYNLNGKVNPSKARTRVADKYQVSRTSLIDSCTRRLDLSAKAYKNLVEAFISSRGSVDSELEKILLTRTNASDEEKLIISQYFRYLEKLIG